MTDRDLLARLPKVELDQLAGLIMGALKGARRAEDRAQLAHVVIEDRPAADIARGGDPLTDHLRRNPTVRSE